ncbi:hypothetical protein FKM82_015293 [Ascaphus truei]
MSGFGKGFSDLQHQAQQKAQDTAKQGEQVVQDCVTKVTDAGQQAIDQGCQTAQKTCDQVSGQVKDKLPGGWK